MDNGNGGNGGSLGGKHGDDCGRDLSLKGRVGFGIRHPKRNKNCGLELAKAELMCRIFVKTYENEE